MWGLNYGLDDKSENPKRFSGGGLIDSGSYLYNFELEQELNPCSGDQYRRQRGQINDTLQTGFSCNPDIAGGKRCVSTCDSSRSRY